VSEPVEAPAWEKHFTPEAEKRAELRAHLAAAFMLAGALEVETRIAAGIDEPLHQACATAHGRACASMVRLQKELKALHGQASS
jgi:hypothetical protein